MNASRKIIGCVLHEFKVKETVGMPSGYRETINSCHPIPVEAGGQKCIKWIVKRFTARICSSRHKS